MTHNVSSSSNHYLTTGYVQACKHIAHFVNTSEQSYNQEMNVLYK